MKKLLFILVLFCGLGINQDAFASHAAGGELTYEWISGSTYRFTYKFYRDCTGGPQALDSFGMCYQNTCNNTYYKKFLTRILILPNGQPNGTPVPTGCPNPTTCTNIQSTIPGFQEWWYQGDVTLNAQCTEWAFWTNELARNPQNNLTGQDNLYILTTLNNLVAQGNSSPNFAFKPVPYICLNQPWIYNNGAFDVNGDSLSYASILPYTSAVSTSTLTANGSDCAGNYPPGNVVGATTFPYNPATLAIPCQGNSYGVTPTTGVLNTIPNVAGQYVITIEVTEWRNGIKIGEIIRDIQVSVVPCVVQLPIANLPVISGAVFDLASLSYKSCIGDTISFCALITGPVDTAQIIAQSNIPIVLPGAVFNFVGLGSDSLLICCSWIPNGITDTGLHNIIIQYQDTSCLYNPIGVINSFTLPIYVNPVTIGRGDTTICKGVTVPLKVVGGSSFVWNALPGGSGNSSLSCTNCPNPFATPDTTTSYTVISNLTSQCGDNIDTVTIIVLPIPKVNAGIDTTLCPNGSYQMQANVTPIIGNYAYQWTPTLTLSNSSILNPIVNSPTQTTDYVLQVILNGNALCAVRDTMRINVLQGFDIKNNDTTVCKGATVFITTIGSNSYTYLWTPNVNINNVNIKNPNITPDTLITYTLTASYPGCPDSIQSITLNVELIPKVNAGFDRLLCQYDTCRLEGKVLPDVPDPFYTYTWTNALNLSNTNTLDPYFTGLTNTTYTLTVSTPKGCKGTDNMTIQVIPNGFLTGLQDVAICPGVAVTRTAVGGVSYLWQPGIELSDSTAKTITTSPIATTIFTLYGTDINGCTDTTTFKIFVAPNAIISLGPDVTIFPGEDAAELYAGGNCNMWSWSPATGLDYTNVIDPNALPTATTQYVVTGSTEYNCTTTDTIIVNINPNTLKNVSNAFTPGNGGPNNEFKVDHNGVVKLIYFRVFNRWGTMVFETNDINKGWDGKFKNSPQPIGTYVYQIDGEDLSGKHLVKTGNVSLIR